MGLVREFHGWAYGWVAAGSGCRNAEAWNQLTQPGTTGKVRLSRKRNEHKRFQIKEHSEIL